MKNALAYSQPSLFPRKDVEPRKTSLPRLLQELASFDRFGTKTQFAEIKDGNTSIPVFLNEFWTSKQRAANSLHEISYRACFKPQLPRFFIERLTRSGATVYDPFLGRGTTIIEAALLGRKICGCDVNPLSAILSAPRLAPPTVNEVYCRLAELNWSYKGKISEELLVFYHPDTLREIYALRSHLLGAKRRNDLSSVDAWIRMVATNRLTGHSAGFFSVYTLPPNQAVSSDRQERINKLREQTPPKRNVAELIVRKTETLLKDVTTEDRSALQDAASDALFITGSSDRTPAVGSCSIDLVVTSPPFLDVVDYAGDNWLRCWFNGIDQDKVGIWTYRKADEWSAQMTLVFCELSRVLKPGGYVAFEVGEVRGGKIKMEDLVIPAARGAGLEPVLVLINSQEFTKTSNCWGVTNQTSGTNTNRVVLLRKSR